MADKINMDVIMRLVLLLFVFGCLVSCNQKQEPDQVKEIDATFYKPDGDRVGTHRDADGIQYSDWDVFAPREGETKQEHKERMDDL